MKGAINIFFLCLILFFSFGAFLGFSFGYFMARVYLEKLVKKFSLPRSIFLPLGNKYCLKFHHWLSSFLLLLTILTFKISYFSSPFFISLFWGVAYHDFVTDKDWYKILVKK